MVPLELGKFEMFRAQVIFASDKHN